MASVGQDEDGALDAAEEFLYDDLRRGIAEHAAEHLAQFATGFVEGGQDEHALAGAEAVGLQYVRCGKGLKEGEPFVEAVCGEAAVSGGGDVVTLHELLGELLAAFEHGTGTGGSDDGYAGEAGVALEVVIDALDERVFRSDDDHVYAVVDDKAADGVEVICLDGDVLAHVACPCIAGSDVEFFHFRALGYLPRQRMFAPARTK